MGFVRDGGNQYRKSSLQARSAVCLANLKHLRGFCDHKGIEKQRVDTLTKAIKAVDRWLEGEFGEENKGPIALLP